LSWTFDTRGSRDLAADVDGHPQGIVDRGSGPGHLVRRLRLTTVTAARRGCGDGSAALKLAFPCVVVRFGNRWPTRVGRALTESVPDRFADKTPDLTGQLPGRTKQAPRIAFGF
jgi:hypothetical protein